MWNCPNHGRGCMGHFEQPESSDTIMMPCTLVPNIDSVVNRYQRYKNSLCSNKITSLEYRQLTSKMMMGKNGLVRSMNQIRIDGSMKMVISSCLKSESNIIMIPSSISNKILIPKVEGSKVVYK